MFLKESQNLLTSCLQRSPPELFIGASNSDHYEEFIFYRTLELQIEYCKSIRVLCENGLFRPAYSILRSILENMATLMWLTLDIDKYPRLFEEGKQPNTREILRRIGWESEYDRTFRFLSKFVHSSLVNSDFYKKTSEPNSWIDLKDGSYWANALVTENEVLIIETENGFEILEIHQMTEEETNTLYAPYLSIRAIAF